MLNSLRLNLTKNPQRFASAKLCRRISRAVGLERLLHRYASSCKQTGAALLLAALKESAKQSVIQAIPPPNKEVKLFQAMYQIKIRVWVRQICMRFKFKI